MSKLLVYGTAIFFLIYGAVFIVYPVDMAYWVTGSSPATSVSLIDFRATYGGAQLSIGVILLLLMKLRADIDFALVIVATSLLLMAVGRTVGILVDGQASVLMFAYLAAELGFGVLALFLRR